MPLGKAIRLYRKYNGIDGVRSNTDSIPVRLRLMAVQMLFGSCFHTIDHIHLTFVEGFYHRRSRATGGCTGDLPHITESIWPGTGITCGSQGYEARKDDEGAPRRFIGTQRIPQ